MTKWAAVAKLGVLVPCVQEGERKAIVLEREGIVKERQQLSMAQEQCCAAQQDAERLKAQVSQS